MELLVSRIWDAAQGIRAFELRHPEAAELPPFTPGAHLKLWVTIADGTRKLREYSLVNSPSERTRYQIAVLLEPNGDGGSAAMHRLREGERLTVDMVANEFLLEPRAQESILIAGGIGITPILCMARALAQQGKAIQVHYASRSADRMAFREEVLALPGAALYFDEGDPARGIPLDQVLAAPTPGRHVYVCGPRGLIAGVLDRAAVLGWPKEQVHFESFAGAVALKADQTIQLELRASGRRLEVAADQSILDALIAAGLDPLYDCRRGECGMCITPVLAGTPDHRDHALTQRERDEGKSICTCVSRARTPELVLDL